MEMNRPSDTCVYGLKRCLARFLELENIDHLSQLLEPLVLLVRFLPKEST
jgi:hypothetical protein